jgi:hypothetical protein
MRAEFPKGFYWLLLVMGIAQYERERGAVRTLYLRVFFVLLFIKRFLRLRGPARCH